MRRCRRSAGESMVIQGNVVVDRGRRTVACGFWSKRTEDSAHTGRSSRIGHRSSPGRRHAREPGRPLFSFWPAREIAYALRSAGHGYDLKVTFTVNSGGQTEYDGAWEMEDVFDPQQGLRWTAKAAAGYTTTQISSNEMFYGEGTASPFHSACRRRAQPCSTRCRLRETLIATRSGRQRQPSTARKLPAFCSPVQETPASAAPGRRWEETEECIDPQSGLLQVHSQVPGRYYAYDYSNAPQLGGHVLPRKVTVTEAGKTVSEISVDSLTELPAADPSLFVPTEEMKARGPAIAMAGGAKNLARFWTGSVPVWRDGPAGVRVWPGYGVGTAGRGALVAAVRSEQSSGCRSRETDEFLSARAARSTPSAALCICHREVCFFTIDVIMAST